MEERKNKFALRMTDKTQTLVREWYGKAGCRSQNEFIEKAIQFYASYLSSEEGDEYLSTTLTKVIQAPLKNAEDRIARLLFKLAVEDSMMMRVLASALEVDELTLHSLRGKCVQDVKQTHGSITLREAMRLEYEDPLPRNDDDE